jgi:DnaJ-class molecular chaperone
LSDENKRRIYDRSDRETRRGQAEGARAGHRHGEHQDQRFEDPYHIFREVFGDTDPFALIDNLLTAVGASFVTRDVTNAALRVARPFLLQRFIVR